MPFRTVASAGLLVFSTAPAFAAEIGCEGLFY